MTVTLKKPYKKKALKHKARVIKKTTRNKRTLNVVNEPEVEYQILSNKSIDESWDFRKANTKEYTHCFHPYPAMMIPQVARRILDNFGRNSKMLFDPYCGTGTSLVEANLKGVNEIKI